MRLRTPICQILASLFAAILILAIGIKVWADEPLAETAQNSDISADANLQYTMKVFYKGQAEPDNLIFTVAKEFNETAPTITKNYEGTDLMITAGQTVYVKISFHTQRRPLSGSAGDYFMIQIPDIFKFSDTGKVSLMDGATELGEWNVASNLVKVTFNDLAAGMAEIKNGKINLQGTVNAEDIEYEWDDVHVITAPGNSNRPSGPLESPSGNNPMISKTGLQSGGAGSEKVQWTMMINRDALAEYMMGETVTVKQDIYIEDTFSAETYRMDLTDGLAVSITSVIFRLNTNLEPTNSWASDTSIKPQFANGGALVCETGMAGDEDAYNDFKIALKTSYGGQPVCGSFNVTSDGTEAGELIERKIVLYLGDVPGNGLKAIAGSTNAERTANFRAAYGERLSEEEMNAYIAKFEAIDYDVLNISFVVTGYLKGGSPRETTELVNEAKMTWDAGTESIVTGSALVQSYDSGAVGLPPGSAELTKSDDKGNTLLNVQFYLEKKNEANGVWETYYYDDTNYMKATDEEGKVIFTELATGCYRFVENAAPRGYRMTEAYSDPFDIDVEKDAQGKTLTKENPRVLGMLRIRKVQTGTEQELDGAEFFLSDENGEYYIGTDEKGALMWGAEVDAKTITTADTITGLDWGAYNVKEVIAPQGYLLNETPVTVKVDQTTVVDSTNTPATIVVRVENSPVQTTNKGDKTKEQKTELKVDKTVVEVNGVLTYTVTVTNISDATEATDIEVKDYVPDNTRFLSVENGGESNMEIGKEYVIWNIKYLKPSESVTLTFKVRVEECISGVAIKNTVLVSDGKGVRNYSNEVETIVKENTGKPGTATRSGTINRRTRSVKTGDHSSLIGYAVLLTGAFACCVCLKKR